MRKLSCALSVLLLCTLAEAAPQDAHSVVPQAKIVSDVSVGLHEAAPSVSRGQIAVCANLAAIRALGAKAAGSDYPTQGRILDLTFVLCLAGAPSES